MSGHLFSLLEPPVVFQVNGDAGCPSGDIRWCFRVSARDYFVDWDSFVAWTSALAKLSTFLSTTKAVTASLSAC